MQSLLEILKRTITHFEQREIPSSRRQAEETISEALGIQRLQLYTDFDRPLTPPELDRCRTFVMRRANREPLQYICGSVEFYGCRFQVTPAVLIPRQETEILVDKIAQELSKEVLSGKTLWDICCGSGCIGIALKKKFPELKVILSDISSAALTIAKENALANEAEVTCIEGDLLAPFSGMKSHFVVCNPPYISEKEFVGLDVEVRDHEPKIALVSGSSGLEFYERLANELPSYLLPEGKLWLEIGTGQGKTVQELFSSWKNCYVELDWAGHTRFCKALYS